MTVKVSGQFTVDLDIDQVKSQLADALTPVELLDLFSITANKIADGITFAQRRAFADTFRYAMSENAKKLLAEILAAEYIRQTLNVPEFP